MKKANLAAIKLIIYKSEAFATLHNKEEIIIQCEIALNKAFVYLNNFPLVFPYTTSSTYHF